LLYYELLINGGESSHRLLKFEIWYTLQKFGMDY
jgi:hypothetical protein